MKKHIRKQSGFTLVEMLVAVAIFSLFIVVSVDSFINILRTEDKTNVLRITQENTRNIMEAIIRDARTANGEIDSTGLRITHAYVTNHPTDDKLTLISTYNGITTRALYYLNSGILEKQIDSGDIVPLNDINDLKIDKFMIKVAFAPNCTETEYNNDCPPELTVELQAESGQGVKTGNGAFTANVDLVSSATPRTY